MKCAHGYVNRDLCDVCPLTDRLERIFQKVSVPRIWVRTSDAPDVVAIYPEQEDAPRGAN